MYTLNVFNSLILYLTLSTPIFEQIVYLLQYSEVPGRSSSKGEFVVTTGFVSF